MESITSFSAQIHFNYMGYEALEDLLKRTNYSSVFILVDENTREHCLPIFLASIGGKTKFEVVEIESGEINKSISSCMKVWNALSEKGSDRQSLLINLGGGVITDLGGFVASTFRRGIDFINIPTSLLAMVDASVGGKTGVDLGLLKNQIGVINQPKMVLIIPKFLNTLDKRQLNSGFAEMLKHGLITSEPYWRTLKQVDSAEQFEDHIYDSIVIKNEVVRQDPREKNLRRILNFGHTLGHAIESYFLENTERDTLLHGEAIAIGMIMEAFLSHQLTGLGINQLVDIKETILKHFDKVDFDDKAIHAIINLLKYDKKNSHGSVYFVLLKRIGEAQIDNRVPDDLLNQAFSYYKE
ncbi:3-dehydroquinate synthase [uncultured Eudoraea sp.]|uniref:3-dehydroquinate synthase n=1 Tax=uncultured Eudoraea sp. TaxID=1035614 RepID=UPI0026397371|nr:3-dehydroquinate synthase [uncultured Eudoraea sp.]